ncbi:hypothetical protein BYT27DRAFT_7210221 [Phlegmacium glaucopus]|nr:hypothetical protein BYT27DRAFT_7210221 [Phlegmacium glaucopus]
MTGCPKCSTVTNQEATDKLLDNKKCHSSAQVQLEKQTAASTAAASEVKKINIAVQKKQQVAAFEDQLFKEEHDKNMAHPDLAPAHYLVTALSNLPYWFLEFKSLIGKTKHPATELLSEGIKYKAKINSPEPESGLEEDHEVEQEGPVLEPELEFADVGLEEQDYVLSEGLANIPDESAVDTESSDDRDHEKDEDYLMELDDDGDNGSDLDSDGEFYLREVCEPSKNPGKAKAAKSIKFQMCNYQFSYIPKAQSLRNVPRRLKEGFSLGGQQSCKAAARNNLSLTSSCQAVEDQDDPLKYTGSEFDEDEPIESVRAAHNVKPAVTTVNIFEPVVPEMSSSGCCVKKIRYNFSFPFLVGQQAPPTLMIGGNTLNQPSIHWATTHKDPFRANSVMEDVVTEIWKVVFSSIANEVDGGSHEAIVHVAADALIDWCSSMGKESLHLVLHAFNEEGVKNEDVCQAAEYYLKNYCFIYQNPDNDTLECGLELIKASHVGLDGSDTDIFNDDALLMLSTEESPKIQSELGFTINWPIQAPTLHQFIKIIPYGHIFDTPDLPSLITMQDTQMQWLGGNQLGGGQQQLAVLMTPSGELFSILQSTRWIGLLVMVM